MFTTWWLSFWHHINTDLGRSFLKVSVESSQWVFRLIKRNNVGGLGLAGFMLLAQCTNLADSDPQNLKAQRYVLNFRWQVIVALGSLQLEEIYEFSLKDCKWMTSLHLCLTIHCLTNQMAYGYRNTDDIGQKVRYGHINIIVT